MSLGCRSNKGQQREDQSSSVVVLRVESSSPDHPGAEHCDERGNSCVPLAASQKLGAQGIVRTFAGGKISLDFGGGRRVDLDSLSQLRLDQQIAHLKSGSFSLETTPLVTKDTDIVPLDFTVAGKTFHSPRDRATSASLTVEEDQTILTVRRGQLEADGLKATPRTGQSIRIAQARAFRTASDGSELPHLLPAAPRRSEFGALLNAPQAREALGLGTMSARLPNTKEKRNGVRLLKHHAQVVIQDGYAHTEIIEEFENTTPHILEGQYRFAVPADASVSRLGLWVGDQLMEGEVLERKRAASIYSSIVDRPVPRDPALLEWESGGVMSLKVFPILPKKSRRVLLSYQQVLSSEGGLLRYVHPLSLGAERANQIGDFSIEISARDNTATLSSPEIRAYDAELSEKEGQIKARFSATDFVPHGDFALLIRRRSDSDAELSAQVDGWPKADAELPPFLKAAPGKRTLLSNTRKPSAQPAVAQEAVDGHFGLRLQVSLPDESLRPEFRPLRRVIALDVSHSQSKETISAQAALAFGLLLEMDPDEPFVLLACDSACEAWEEGGPSQQLLSTEQLPARLAAAQKFLAGLRPGGASDVAGALATAALQLQSGRLGKGAHQDNAIAQIVYLGDARASAGELSAESIAARVGPLLEEARAELRLVGVGPSLDQHLLEGLAIELDATWDLLASGLALEARIEELAGVLRRPTIKNARLELPEGLIATESHALPALRLGQELIVSGELRSLSPGPVVLTGTLAGHPYRLERPLSFPASRRRSNTMIAPLWAKHRIALLQALDRSEDNKQAVIDLSQRFRTMSRYTSFLVLENDEMYKHFGIDRPERELTFETLFEDEVQFETNDPFAKPKEAAPPSLSDIGTIGAEPSGPTSKGRMTSSSSSGAARGAARRPPPTSPSPRKAKPRSRPPGGGDPSADAELGIPSFAEAPRPASKPQASVPTDISNHFGGHKSRVPLPRARLPRRRRFHLKATVADEQWRKWGKQQMDQVQASLKRDPHSRARHEAWVRVLLQGGRFDRAAQAAQDYFDLDPDHLGAVRLLGQASVTAGDHERARQMLDIENELHSEDQGAHLQAARAFIAVGDTVRACAHARSLFSLEPKNTEYRQEAHACFEEILGRAAPRPQSSLGEGEAGQLQITVECASSVSMLDCPSPVLITPFGEVFSPWTPGLGKTNRHRVSLLKLRSGSSWLLVSGGSPGAKGVVKIAGSHENASIKFSGGSLHTVAQLELSYY